ncbi:unnamed protein product, partial [Ectocarpus sp. 13 AM-2016]
FFRHVFEWATADNQTVKSCLDITKHTLKKTNLAEFACPYLYREDDNDDTCDEVPETLAPDNQMLSGGED